MNLPDRMIHQSFRYCFGRQTYVVSEFVEWAIENWKSIPKEEKDIIVRDLDNNLQYAKDTFSYSRFGAKIDFEQWKKLIDHYRKD